MSRPWIVGITCLCFLICAPSMAGLAVEDGSYLGKHAASPIVPVFFIEWYARFITVFLKWALPGTIHVVLNSLIVYRVSYDKMNIGIILAHIKI